MAVASVLPNVPVRHADFISYIKNNDEKPLTELLEPYKQYDAKLREIFAQEPENPALSDPYLNVVPLYNGHEADVKIRARQLNLETPEMQEKYVMPLALEARRSTGSPAIVNSLAEFQRNFALFSESSLVDLDWNNVFAAGSAVVTSLLPVPEKFKKSKKSLRKYYHEVVAPASDVDLFLYGLSEQEAVKKIIEIETCIKNSILSETTTIRTKNAITIASQYPTRHIQIVLRIYKSVSEILTGFDVDCSCAAYNGKAVYASPRAIVSYMTQCNTVDLTRRSPSYESRLSKYSHRGFEVHWPLLDRSRIDPTIFERNFGRTVGLARLLVLEKLPTTSDRESYMDQRRRERGRPAIDRYRRYTARGNIKEGHDDEIAEWVVQEDVSDYHTFTIPYGPKYHAKKIEKLLYTKDLLLNAEWNKPKDREVNLHRHPAFFGFAEDIIHDCCGFCPEPETPEEHDIAEAEAKVYVSGEISFIKDDPGRQAIGSFNPITDDDWTEMAYVGNSARLCQAIVDGDLEHVEDWLSQPGADPNCRDYTGRTPLQLATISSTPEIVQTLIDHGARLVARLADGRTALHLACERGNVEMVQMILRKSEANEEEEAEKQTVRKRMKAEERAKRAQAAHNPVQGAELPEEDRAPDEDDLEVVEKDESESDVDIKSTTTGSFLKVKAEEKPQDDLVPEDENEPDVYDVNVLAWDTQCSPLHLAILNGHTEVVRELVQTFGADVLLPVKLYHTYGEKKPRGAILTLVLAMRLPLDKAKAMTKTLLEVGASSAQGDMDNVTAFTAFAGADAELLELLFEHDEPAAKGALNHISVSGSHWSPHTQTPLGNAIAKGNSLAALKLLEAGANPVIGFKEWINAIAQVQSHILHRDGDQNLKEFQTKLEQPVILAAEAELPKVVLKLLSCGADPNTITKTSHQILTDGWYSRYHNPNSLLDVVRQKIIELRNFEDDKPPVPPNPGFEEGVDHLKGIPPASYKFFSAQCQLEAGQQAYEQDMKDYHNRLEAYNSRKGVDEKMGAIKQLLQEFRDVERELIRLEAKSFHELHPDKVHVAPTSDWKPSTEFKHSKIEFGFKVYDITQETREAYVRLFQAAWDGDLDTIKELTLSSWGVDGDKPPLIIAVQDTHGNSPFSLAVLRGHISVARTIVEISAAQYEPKEKEARARYRIGKSEDDYEEEYESEDNDEDRSLGSADDVPVYKEVIEDRFTYENFGQISAEVKSEISPLTLMGWTSTPGRYAKLSEDPKFPGTMQDGFDEHMSLISWAIISNDMNLFSLLLDLKLEWADKLHSIGEIGSPIDKFSPSEIQLAMKHGRVSMLADMIKHTGACLEIESLIKASGVKLVEKPKYYQGLSVHGKKRADWAAAAQGVYIEPASESSPPLLQASFMGNLESVEWFLSDTPARHYRDFAEANRNDKYIHHLNAVGGGFEKVLSKWLGARRELVIHCAVMAKSNLQTSDLLRYLLDAVPESLEARSKQGYTPLMLAFELKRFEAAKILIAAGADQTVRDGNGNNLLHLLVCSQTMYSDESQTAKSFSDLIDERLIASLLSERSSEGPGSATPLARYLHQGGTSDMLRFLLTLAEPTNNRHLELIDGTGNTPLHQVVHKEEFFKIMLEYRPDLLHRENATGRTPAEMVADAYTARRVKDPEQIPYHQSRESIIRRHISTFVSGEQKQDSRDFVWEVRGFMSNHPQKRQMVSLMDATEVAKRLATRYAHRQNYLVMGRDDESDAENDAPHEAVVFEDEVSKWRRFGEVVQLFGRFNAGIRY